MPGAIVDLWQLVRRPRIDPDDLAMAVQLQADGGDLDYRTRWLVHDSLAALQRYWGRAQFEQWLQHCPNRNQIEAIAQEEFERAGFPSLVQRMEEKTEPQQIEQYLRELGQKITHAVRVHIGGSAALILEHYLSRATEDIDIVDEVPAEIRTLHTELEKLHERYGLYLAHFQSHYLPPGWEQRAHYREPFGKLQVYLVDVYDVFLSKLFSAREKDRDDLRALAPQLDRERLVQRLHETAAVFLKEEKLRQNAQQNWYIVFGDDLPHDPDNATGQGPAGCPRP
jgi:hypothetical protein